MDFFGQGVPLGRWFKINVIMHWTFILYAAFSLYSSPREDLGVQALFMVMLFGTVLLHEFGHALSCLTVGGQADRIILWPLGGIAFVQPPMKPTAWLITTVCGPLVNAILWPLFYFATKMLVLQHFGPAIWDILRDDLSSRQGVALLDSQLGIPIQACALIWQINKMLLLFNLIPAYPMDGGRILQELLWYAVGYSRSRLIAGGVGMAAGTAFILAGLGMIQFVIPVLNYHLGGPGSDYMLAVIGYLCITSSMNIFRQAQHALAAGQP